MNTDYGLKGRRILISRPLRQGDTLAAAIESLGGEAIRVPAVDIVPLAESEVGKSKILDIDLQDVIIVISPNAARLLVEWLDICWPQLPSHPRWIAVGPASAAILSAQGIAPAVPAASSDSEGVLALETLQQVAGQKVLLVKGEGGRDTLATELSMRDANVTELVLYQRRLPDVTSAVLRERIGPSLPDAMIATSIEILKNLDTLLLTLGETHRAVPIVVASERIKHVADQLGYQRIALANGASDESILAALNIIG